MKKIINKWCEYFIKTPSNIEIFITKNVLYTNTFTKKDNLHNMITLLNTYHFYITLHY